jgi:hypothetical protein
VTLTTVLESCDHETSGWPHLYETYLDFSTTYQMLGANSMVANLHLQHGLLCRLGHLSVPSSECAKLIWESHYSRVEGHFGIEKTVAVLQKHVRKTGPRSNKIKQCGNKTQKIHNTRETQIYVVHPVWATSTREIARSFLYYYPTNEGIQPTKKPIVASSSFSHRLLSQNTIFTLNHSRNMFPS